MNKLQKILDWKTNKPKTDTQWAEDVKKESLDIKYDYQLKEMLESHSAKIPKVQKDIDKFTNFPDAIRFELNEQFVQMFEDAGNPTKVEGKTLQQWIDEEFESQQLYYNWKIAKLNQSVKRIGKEIGLRAKGYVVPDKIDKETLADITGVPKDRIREIKGTTYYIDSDNGNNVNDGLTTGAAFADLHKFTETSRSAGDIAILRRGMTNRYDDGGDLAFTSDGTIDNPIIIEADYANVFSDDVDLSVTATATLIFGSKTITFSSDISGVLAAGDWIYVASEDAKEFAYEVDSVSTVTVTLFLPYKGDQAGSSKAMTNMQGTPIWNTAAGNFQAVLNNDINWKIQGIHFRGTDSTGVFIFINQILAILKDCILEGNGLGDEGTNYGTSTTYSDLKMFKTRIFNCQTAFLFTSKGDISFKDSLIDGNNVGSSRAMLFDAYDSVIMEETEIINMASEDMQISNKTSISIFLKNVIGDNFVGPEFIGADRYGYFIEDFNGIVDDNRRINGFSSGAGVPIYQSETSTVRSGGSNKSIKVTPNSRLGANWELSRVKLFELPIFATTDSKQYEIFFRPTATGDWTDDPTALELWIEIEAWGHASNNFRKITKSTGVIDMNGSTNWQSLIITVAPAQAGVAYLKCYYAKTKESGKANTFFCDPIPEVT